jgi:small subunit ribosomal protein S15
LCGEVGLRFLVLPGQWSFLMQTKQEVIEKFKLSENDTGSSEVQIALMTERINHLTEHFKIHKKDFAGRRGLLRLVSQRRSLLDYLRGKSEGRYTKVIGQLNIRK